MPKIVVVIEYDWPEDPYWLNPDNVALYLHAYCKRTKFKVSWAENGDPWRDEVESWTSTPGDAEAIWAELGG